MSVCEHPKTDTIVFTKGNWFARRLWKQAPQRDFGRYRATICGQSYAIALLEGDAPTR